MAIKFTLDHGGYVNEDGDIQVVGVGDDGAKHGERGQCEQDHAHSKACAVALLDHHPVITPAGVDGDGDPIAEVLGPSIRERMTAWFSTYDATPDDPKRVAMPTKKINVKNEKGKLVEREVEDRDL